jgi:prepilin-type N-terminal cleavage/methylation domain-containing protein
MYRTHRKGRRAGFTLVELLVVIAILAILTSLLSAAVYRVWTTGYNAQARADVSGLQSALEACRARYGLDYIPSQLILRRNVKNYSTTNATEIASANILRKMFGKSLFSGAANNIVWNGQGAGNGPYHLYGQQCLVFFAGGIPDQAGKACTGFSTNNANPAQTGGSRDGPWFDFRPERLVADSNGFFLYVDPYPSNAQKPKQYYAFFSANGVQNGYVTADCTIPTTGAGSLNTSDVPATKGPKYPQAYIVAAGKYQNPMSFQILCAGQDGEWATASNPVWTYDGTAAITDPAGQDNVTNFTKGTLAGTAN